MELSLEDQSSDRSPQSVENRACSLGGRSPAEGWLPLKLMTSLRQAREGQGHPHFEVKGEGTGLHVDVCPW